MARSTSASQRSARSPPNRPPGRGERPARWGAPRVPRGHRPDGAESTPGGRPSPPPAGALTSSSSSPTTSVRQLGCYGSDISRPDARRPGRGRPAVHELPHHGAVLAHPGLLAHRPEPPHRRDGPRHRPVHGLPGLRRVPAVEVAGRCPRSSRPTATPPTPSGSGTSPPSTSTTSVPVESSGPSARASSAGTATSTARPASSARTPQADNHAVPAPGDHHDGYHLTGT